MTSELTDDNVRTLHALVKDPIEALLYSCVEAGSLQVAWATSNLEATMTFGTRWQPRASSGGG